MLAYRHAFHAGNHADVLKHLVLVQLLDHLNEKEKGWRYVDTHAGAGGYSLAGAYALKHREFDDGIARLLNHSGRLPEPVARYLSLVRSFDGSQTSTPATEAMGDSHGLALPVTHSAPDHADSRTSKAAAGSTTQASRSAGGAAAETAVGQRNARNPHPPLRQYPGSPALARALMRAQDQLRLFELHPTEHKILSSYLAGEPGCEVRLGDGYAALKSVLPPPTRRGLTLIDPPYELKTDYPRALAALREALARFPQGMVMVWLPQLQLVEAVQLPQRLKATADTAAKKGWLHARLSVARADERGFGLLGSSVFVANPPHTLPAKLQTVLPWLAEVLAQFDGAQGGVESKVT